MCDFEIGSAMENRHRMDSGGDQGSDLIGGTRAVRAQGRKKVGKAGGLRCFHGKEVLAWESFVKKAIGAGSMKRIGNGVRR